MDALALLQKDHQTVEKLFARKAKEMAPTHAPGEPPGNVLAGGLAAILDRGRDAMKGRWRATAARELLAGRLAKPKCTRSRFHGGTLKC
jgi:hypothetical protein